MFPHPRFRDRTHAGEELAEAIGADLEKLPVAETASPLVYALPRGGLPVAEPVARRLGCPLSVVVAKKITLPENPELALGAVTSDGYVLWSDRRPGSFSDQHSILRHAHTKAQNQWQQFSAYCPPVAIADRLILLVDDGIATGMTVEVAVDAVRSQKPAAIWICVPVAPLEVLPSLREYCDRLIVLKTPEIFLSVSRFYEEFPQVETSEAIECLKRQNN